MKVSKELMLICAMYCLATMAFAQYKKIEIKISQASVTYKPELRPVLDSAFVIASAVFSSPEFQDRVKAINFDYASWCLNKTDCGKNEDSRPQGLEGSEVLIQLFKETNVTMKCVLKKRSPSSLGKTCPWTNETTAFYKNIMSDMASSRMTPAYKIAVNLCHEYMHQVGFCHTYDSINEQDEMPDPRYYKKDVTYTIGWDVYYILNDWYKAQKKIDGL